MKLVCRITPKPYKGSPTDFLLPASLDPANIPLPPSPEVVPFILTETNTPDLSLAGTGQATPTAASGLSLFNTPRNPLPSSPSAALGNHRPKTPSPLPSPVVQPTTDVEAVGEEENIPSVVIEDAQSTVEPVSANESTEQPTKPKAEVAESTIAEEAADNRTRKRLFDATRPPTHP